jgi:hypothetical protein
VVGICPVMTMRFTIDTNAFCHTDLVGRYNEYWFPGGVRGEGGRHGDAGGVPGEAGPRGHAGQELLRSRRPRLGRA